MRRRRYVRYSSNSDEPVQKKSAWHHFFMIVLIVMFVFTAVSMQGCSADDTPRKCKDWIIEHYQTNIAAYEECRDLLNCELDRADVWAYMDNKKELEACEQYTKPPEVIIQ